MQRYDILQEPGGCCPLPELEKCEGGEWVMWDDHQAKVGELEDENLILSKENNELKSKIHDIQDAVSRAMKP